MADTIDSISIELTASTKSAEDSIQRVIDMLRMLKAATIDASVESRIGKSIRSIAKAAKEVDTDAGQKLARLAGGLKALSKVGDLSNLADAGKNLSSVVRAVNSMGQSGGKGLSGLANGIKQTNDALESIKDADVSKLNAVKDALSGEMSGSLHTSSRASESASLGGMGTPEPSFGNMAAYGAMTVFKYTADSIRDATMAYREFGAALAGGGSTVDTQFTDSMMTVFKYTADSIRDATAAYREFQAALGSGVPPIFTEFADNAAQAGGSARMLTGSVGENAEGPWVADEIRDAARAYDDVGNSASAAAQVIETEFVNPTGSAFSTLNNIIWGLGNSISHIGSGFSGIGSMLGMVGNAASTVGSGFMQFTGIAGFAKDILFGIGNDADTASKKMGGLAKMAQNVGGAFSRYGFAAIPKYFGGQLIGNIQKATKGLTGFFHSIVRIAKYRLIRTALRMITQGINEGIKNLYAFSQAAGGTFASSMNQIATASKYLGNSFAAMASPLVEALAPAIDFIVDKFVDMFNTISQIIARLTGKSTYTVAKKVASTWGDAAKSASSGAKDAADEIKRTIMGFDEINKLSKESSSSGGGGSGGGSGGGASSMFEEMPIDGAVSSFADSLKAAFEEGNWQELGELLGGKVNELVESIDFAGAGQKVGYAINAWFSTKYWTLDTINFTNIGSKIAEFLNNAIAEIDFSIIGASLVQKLTIIGDLIIGFFTDFDWGQAADKFSDFVKGIFNEISKWLDKYDWGDVGNTIYTKLKDALTNLDLSGVATSFVTALGKAIKAVVSAGAGFLAGFWADVTAYWDEHIKADDFTTTVHNILDAIGQGFSNLGEWVWNSIIKPFGAALTGNENWDTELLDVGKNIIEGIFNGIVSVISGVGTWIKTNIFDPFLKWLKSVFGIASPASTMEEPGKNIVLGIFQGIINALANVGQWVKENIFDPIWEAVKNVFGDFTIAISAAVKLIKDGWTSLTKWVGDIGDKAVSLAKDGWTSLTKWVGDIGDKAVSLIKSGWTSLTTWVGDIGDKAVSLVKDGWTTLTKWVGNIGDKAVSLAKDGWTSLSSWVGDIGDKAVSLVKNGWITLTAWVGNISDKSVSLIKSGWTTLTSWVGEIGDKAFALAKDGWVTIGGFVGQIGEKVFSLGKSGWDTISNFVGTIGEKVFSLGKSGWVTIGGFVGQIGEKVFSLGKSGWDTISNFVGTIGEKVFSLGKSGWTTISDFVGEIGNKAFNLLMNIEDTAKAIINFLKNPLTATKNVTLAVIDSFTDAVKKMLDFVTNKDNKYKVEVDAYGNMQVVPVSGNGLKVTGSGNSTKVSLANDISGNAKVGLTQNWTGTAQKELKIDDLSTSVSVGLSAVWGALTAVAFLGFLKLTGLSVNITANLLPGWTGDSKKDKTTAIEALGLNDLKTSVSVSLVRAWGSGSTIKALGIDQLATSVKVSLKKTWTSTLSTLGLTGLTAQIKVKLVKGSPNKIEVSKDGDTKWELSVKKLGGVFAKGMWKSLPQFANGGIFSSGFWRSLPKYANGSNNVHGSMFLAGEAGPELVGHIGGRTEVLNQSQLAATMFSAVRAAMGGVKIAATMYDGGDNGDADYETMYRAMYDAFTDAMTGSNERDKEKVALMRQIAAKEFTAEVTANSIANAQRQQNRRAGLTVVPVT